MFQSVSILSDNTRIRNCGIHLSKDADDYDYDEADSPLQIMLMSLMVMRRLIVTTTEDAVDYDYDEAAETDHYRGCIYEDDGIVTTIEGIA